jgi:hypothetical protein
MITAFRPISDKEKLTLEALASNYQEGELHEFQLFHTADFSSSDVPGGSLALHPVGAPVHQDSLPLNAFTYLAICKVNGPVQEGELQKKEKLLQEACPQYSENGPSLKVSGRSQAIDLRHWSAELGEDENAFVGLFKQTKGRDSSYYIAAQAGAPQAVRQLREKLTKGMTFEQLLSDKDYNRADYLAQRNVERLCYNAARALGVRIDNIPDQGAFLEHEYSAKPYKALPSHLQAVSTIRRVAYKGTDSVGIFNRLTPVSGASQLHYIYGGPENGLAEFRMNGRGRGYALPAATPVAGKLQKLPHGLIGAKTANQHEAFDTEEFLDEMTKLGWKAGNTYNLVPVVIKVFDPSVKRK